MEVVPGSHLLPAQETAADYRDIANVHLVPLRLGIGDAILRDSNLLHRGTPNITNRPRLMLDQTYKLKSR